VTEPSSDLPEYANPPVVEVALAVQFQALPGLQPPVLADWLVVRERLPTWELKAPFQMPHELFGVPQIPFFDLRIGNDQPPPSRSWFSTASGTELLQIQPDVLVHNWRKTSDGQPYPRYQHLRQQFERDLVSLQVLVQSKGLGEVVPTQCELSYVNLIDLEHYPLRRIIAGWNGAMSDGFLNEPEQVELASHHRIEPEVGKPRGRLHIQARTIRPARKHQLQLNLVARGAPQGGNLDDILGWFDLAREWIVRGFTSFTSEYMHQHVWGRTR
jgi:uncharacterized protein (TIGR04255 family)